MPQNGFIYKNLIHSRKGLRKLSREQWAYVAGIFDGEGSLVICKPTAAESTAFVYRVDIYQRPENGLLKWLITTFQCGSISHARGRAAASFRLTSTRVVYDFLIGVQPYCIVKKKPVADALKKLRDRYGDL